MPPPERRERLTPRGVNEVRSLVDTVAHADGLAPLSEHVLLHLPVGGDDRVVHLLVHDDDGALVGYAHLDTTDAVAGPSAELAVHPAARRRGVGGALTAALLDETGGRLRLWAHGDHPAAALLAARMGFTRGRVLWQMRRPLDEPLPEPTLPEGVAVRTFEVGRDEQAWTALNALAFADHPDQGGWGLEEVRLREAEPWFDARGFFLAERGTTLVGFHWTKVHGGSLGEGTHDHAALGEVYVVGVDPAEQGRGLGPALTLIGLQHLRGAGLGSAMLYVDEANTNAVRVYERLGFRRYATDVSYTRAAG